MSLSTRTASAPHADSPRAARATAAGVPFAPGWNARDLADAVPLRLFELIDFDALREVDAACANHPAPRRRGWLGGYRANAALPAQLRVRG
jgi:hypothetical protein